MQPRKLKRIVATKQLAGTIQNQLRPWLTAIFFLSGAAGLGYQVVWAKLFATGIGHEFPAVLAVVTAFMAGMALGAFAFERLPASLKFHPGAYGWLELIMGAWGLVTVLLIPAANEWVLNFLGVQWNPVKQWLVVFASVLLCLLPATAAMGATLPAIELTLTAGLPRQAVGLLYGANTGGAVLGAIASAFWVMPRLGLRGTVLLFALVNILCALAAILLTRGLPRVSPGTSPAGRPATRLGIMLVGTGLLGIGYETITIRLLSHALENTIFTFAVVLAVYLGGTALGAFLYQNHGRRAPADSFYLGFLAAACLLSGIAARWLNPFYTIARGWFGDALGAVLLSELATALLVFGLPALAMGATFAHLAQQSLARRPALGWAVSLNTLGATFAPALFGTVLFPLLGTRGTLWLIPLGYALLIPRPRWKFAAAAMVMLLSFALPRSADLIEMPPGSKLAALQNGVMGTASVLESTNRHRVLKVNNRFQMGGTAAATAEQRHADIPLLLHPAPRRAAFLGLGTGITFAAALNHPRLHADGVELSPEVAALMPLFLQGQNPFHAPPLQTFVADARRFMRATDQRYDVIVGDLFHPAQDGTGFLYTVEHFQAVRKRLSPGGLFCQWLPLYQMDDTVLRTVTRTFLEVFPDAQAWLLRLNIQTPVVGLIGYQAEPSFQSDWVERRLSDPPLAAHLRKVALADSIRLFGLFVAGAAELKDFSVGAGLNTDDHPLVVFRAPEFTYRRGAPPYTTLATLLNVVKSDPAEIHFAPGEAEFAGQVALYIEARNVYLKALISEAEGNVHDALDGFIESARISPDFTSGYAQAITIATALARSNPSAAEQILKRLAEAQPSRRLALELLQRLGLENSTGPQ